MMNSDKTVMKGNGGYPNRAGKTVQKGSISAKKEQSAFEASRGKPEKGKVSFKDSRYK